MGNCSHDWVYRYNDDTEDEYVWVYQCSLCGEWSDIRTKKSDVDQADSGDDS